MDLQFKNATQADLKTIVEIYNSTILSGRVTADTHPVTVESKTNWFMEHSVDRRPLWTIMGGNEIIGWVSFQSFYGRPAYAATAEISIYLKESRRGKGIGKYVLQHCINSCPGLKIKTLLGYIFAHN